MIFYHRGYTGSVTYDDGSLRGKVDCHLDCVTYRIGRDIVDPSLADADELYREFCAAVDDYIETRDRLGHAKEDF